MDARQKIEAALAAGPTEDREWELWTSNSWRRIQGVIEPTIQHHDNHPDLHATIATLEYVVAVQPKNIREVLQTLASKEAELAAREAEIAGLLVTCQAMAEDGWLYHGVEGMSEAQKMLYEVITKQPPTE
ncbi:hypothetical protein [Polaromonas sp. YR568]|uniref:hypothetical protein n=1 Tax=Polaromonas sp. YR568 TaxID=1855301 RepID=UPI0031380364